jgi:hypothetical protein
MDNLTVALIIATFALLTSTFYFAVKRKVEIKEIVIPEIDPELENGLAEYEYTLRSIAYDAKTIKAARQLATDALKE